MIGLIQYPKVIFLFVYPSFMKKKKNFLTIRIGALEVQFRQVKQN